jgi:hypothetical protein
VSESHGLQKNDREVRTLKVQQSSQISQIDMRIDRFARRIGTHSGCTVQDRDCPSGCAGRPAPNGTLRLLIRSRNRITDVDLVWQTQREQPGESQPNGGGWSRGIPARRRPVQGEFVRSRRLPPSRAKSTEALHLIRKSLCFLDIA